MGRGRRKESMCGKSALTQAALDLRENWPKKKKPQPKENSLRHNQLLCACSVITSGEQQERGGGRGGAGEKEAERQWRKLWDGNAGAGQVCGEGQRSLGHTSCQDGSGGKANTAVSPAFQIFHPKSTTTK